MTRNILCALVLLSACGGEPHATRDPAELPSSVTPAGETIYFGTVYPLDEDAEVPAYVYERRVGERSGAVVSTHITREPSGAVAIAESAVHSPDYELRSYTLHTSQLGRTGTIRIDGNRVSFHLAGGEEEEEAVEAQSEPVVVGPTLVGFIVRHLDALRAGETVPVRLAVLERLETIGFELGAVEATPDRTRVEMTASSFLVRMAMDPITFTFDRSGKLVGLQGRVPPRVRDGDGWADLDARVEYRYVAPTYR